jgi:glyoxylase I family protein
MANPERKKRAAFEILGLDHIVLRVKDLQRLTRFYCEVIGCSVERERPELGLIQLRAGVSLIDLVSVDGELGRKDRRAGLGAAEREDAQAADPSAEISRDKRSQAGAPGMEGRNMDHLCLRIEPFDQSALVAHLISNGVGVGGIKTRFGADGYGPSLYISDPEGNVIELKGPPTRAGA